MFADIDWFMLVVCVVGSIAGGLIIFHVVAGYYHLRYYVFGRGDAPAWKIQADRWLTSTQQKQAALRSSLNLVLGGAVTGVLVYALTQGWETPIYYDVDDYGWPWTIASTVLLFILNDGAAYYVHRALHSKLLFKRIHRYHHRFVATTTYVTTAVHPAELLMLQAASFAPLFVLPVHAGGIALVLIYILAFNVIDHSGVRLYSRIPWQGPSTFHDDHHTKFHCNFGQHLMLWDRMHGTLRRKHTEYGIDIFGGRGRPDPAVRPDHGADEFVAY